MRQLLAAAPRPGNGTRVNRIARRVGLKRAPSFVEAPVLGTDGAMFTPPRKYPAELRERRSDGLEISERTGERRGAIVRVARQLGVAGDAARLGEPGELGGGLRPVLSTTDRPHIAARPASDRQNALAHALHEYGKLDGIARHPWIE